MAVSKRKRFEIFKRDSFTCQYCGRTPPAAVLECDHVTAVANGGGDESHNLITSCFDCNRGKSDVPLGVVLPSVAERTAREQEIAAQLKKYNAFLLKQRKAADRDIEDIGRHWFRKFLDSDKTYIFAKGSANESSVRMFLRRLPLVHVMEAVDIAHERLPVEGGRDGATFKYFCGVCWRKIRAVEGGGE